MTPPLVTVVVPCLNEAPMIGGCVESVLAADYQEGRIEILVVDGGSTDGTREVASAIAAQHPNVRLLENPRRTQQVALNIGIRAAQGSVIIRMDAHCRFSPDYIRMAVQVLEASGADNVGGRIVTVPREDTRVGRAIAAVLSHPLGVGPSVFRTGAGHLETPRWVHTVPYACYRRDVFDRVGLFNELIDRSEDAELHRRMQRQGLRTLFVPSLVSRYFARSDFRSFWRHSIDNGRWAILPTVRTGTPVVSVKHVVPLFFVLAGLAALAASIALPPSRPFVIALVAAYFGVVASIAVFLSIRSKELALALPLAAAFIMLHTGYGIGSLMALAGFLTSGRRTSEVSVA